uniref:uncharacterized protein LOC122611025 n=1 Tax=Erigeron canadensis TaxID=72917 RepID=UPI001CB92FDC|nr:uncharacterized protein LOC122611025 [Erigeron canadensis]
MRLIKIYEKRFLLLDERVFILEETARDFKCEILENNNNNNNQQKDFAASDESSIGLPLSNKKRDSNIRTKPRLQEIIEIDDDDADDFQFISTLKRKRDSNEVKKELNSDDNDLDYKSTLTTNRVKEIKRDCNSDYVDKIPTRTQPRRNVGELHNHQLTSEGLYSPYSEVKPNILASPFNTNHSTSGQNGNKVDEVYKYAAAKLKEIWESKADMLKEFEKNDELSMNAICALYRQRTQMNIHDQSDISRINQLASLLFKGDSQKNLRETAPELDRLDLHDMKMLAKKYSAPIFDIYHQKIDPFFRPKG